MILQSNKLTGRLPYKKGHKFFELKKLKDIILPILGFRYSEIYHEWTNEDVSAYSLTFFGRNENDRSKDLYIKIYWQLFKYNNPNLELSLINITEDDSLGYIKRQIIIKKEYEEDISVKELNKSGKIINEYYVDNTDIVVKIIIDYYLFLMGDNFIQTKRDIKLRYISYEEGIEI